MDIHGPEIKGTHGYQPGINPDSIPFSVNTEKDMVIRLNSLEMQIRGIKIAIEKDVYMDEVIDYITEVQGALDNIALLLFQENLKKCVAERIKSGVQEALDKVFITIHRLVKK